MEQWLIDNWQWLAGALGALVSFFVPGTRSAWNVVFRVIVRTVLTKKAIIKLVVSLIDPVVKNSKTKIDDALWVDIKGALLKEMNS